MPTSWRNLASVAPHLLCGEALSSVEVLERSSNREIIDAKIAKNAIPANNHPNTTTPQTKTISAVIIVN
jgi:hypothetical protein